MRDASEQAASPASDAQETASHTPVVELLTVEADTGTTGPIVVPHESDGKKRRGIRFGWDNLTYTTRVTAAFAFIAAMTALVAIGVLSFVWEQHFQTWTQSFGCQIITISPFVYSLRLSSGFMAMDTFVLIGKKVCRIVIYKYRKLYQ